MAASRSTKNKPAAKKPAPEKKVCTQCQKSLFTSYFYKSKNIKFADGFLPICKNCFTASCFDPKNNYISKKDFQNILRQMDMIYLEEVFNAMVEKNEKVYSNKKGEIPFDYRKGAIGYYIRAINGLHQYKNSTWDDSVFGSIDEIDSTGFIARQWEEKDIEAKAHCLKVLGYDPFDEDDGSFTDSDRRYGYNILASYLNDMVVEDVSKIEGALSVTKTLLQVKKIDSQINKMLNSFSNDTTKMTNYVNMKSKLTEKLSKTIDEFGLKDAAESANTRTFSYKSKEMQKSGYTKGYFNLFDVKVTDIMKQVSEASAHGLFEQLSFDANDYAEMIKEQHLEIKKLNREIDILQEENRNLYNRVKYLEVHNK